jgi:hypothetical protein
MLHATLNGSVPQDRKHGVSYPNRTSFPIVYFIQLRIPQKGLGSLPAALAATTQPKAMKTP